MATAVKARAVTSATFWRSNSTILAIWTWDSVRTLDPIGSGMKEHPRTWISDQVFINYSAKFDQVSKLSKNLIIFMILSIFFQLENASLYCTLLFVYRGTYAVSFPAHNITARDFILLRLFNFKIIPDHTSLNQLWTYIVTLTLTVVSLVIISINDVGVSWWTRTVKLLGIRNFAAYVAVKKDHQTVIIKSNLEIC